MEVDDDVAVDEAMSLDVVLGDKATVWSDVLAGRKGQYYRFGPEVVMKV